MSAQNPMSPVLDSVVLHCQRYATEKLSYIIPDKRKKLLRRFKTRLPFT